MTEELARLIAKTKRAEGASLLERCVDARLAGHTSPKQVLAALSRWGDEDLSLEAVRACLDSQDLWDRYFEAMENPQAWVNARMRRTQVVHAALDGVEELASPRNGNKRTRTANLHHRLALAGHTPQTKVEHGADEDFLGFLSRMMTPKEVGAPERVAIPERAEGPDG